MQWASIDVQDAFRTVSRYSNQTPAYDDDRRRTDARPRQQIFRVNPNSYSLNLQISDFSGEDFCL